MSIDFSVDVTKEAHDFVAASIKGMGGNEGQNSLIESLNIDCNATFILMVEPGIGINTDCIGSIYLSSSHPEAIEDIMSYAENSFDFFLNEMADSKTPPGAASNIIDYISDDAFFQAAEKYRQYLNP